MSKISTAVKAQQEEKLYRKDETVVNFMNGESFKINPLDTMKMVTASSIFGEASYYRDGKIGKKIKDAYYKLNPLVTGFTVLDKTYDGKTTTEIMESVIDDALSYDFKATLDWAVTLRNEFYMRLNPQVIMVRAAIHPNRKAFTDMYPGEFNRIEQLVMARADEPASQTAYYLYLNGGKGNMPSVLKRSIANKLNKLSRYQVAKYKNHEIGMIDTVRITHANSKVLDELMQTGTVQVEENEKTWENLRSEGKSWKEIFETIDIQHMALLRNLRGVFTEVNDIEFCKKYLEKLKSGVINGKQFPYRYYTALQMIKKSKCNHQPLIIDALEECMDISLANMPKLKGKTMCLSDNSGSAWGAITSEYGSVTIAEIDNLSSVITASLSDEGYVGKFGDKLITHPISKRQGVLHQAEAITKNGSRDVGGSTEGGIWEFFKNAINNKEHWDNIFIYSDQQAGHGGLYGTSRQKAEYKDFSCSANGGYYGRDYINVYDLVLEYRKKVNPKVNVFSVMTAGYDNSILPEQSYRCSIWQGWTGKEINYAYEMNKLWDEVENKK